MTATKLPFSGSTNGKQIKISATSTPGTTIHTAGSGTTNIDEIWIWLSNNHTAAVNFTVEFGGTSSPDDLIQGTINSKTGAYLVIPGWVLNNGLVVKVFASVTNVISAGGFVNRRAPA